MADADELKKLLGEEEPVTTPSSETPEKEKAPAASAEDQEKAKKESELANLKKAIVEAQGVLRETRKKAKEPAKDEEDDEDLPQIDLKDPSAKAWDRRIEKSGAPVRAEIELAKEERLKFALRSFLGDKPVLSSDTTKLKRVMEVYDRIKENSGLTTEGVLLDLERAYAAENADAILAKQREERVARARQDESFADIGITRGSGSEHNEPGKKRNYSAEELDIIKDFERHGAPKLD